MINDSRHVALYSMYLATSNWCTSYFSLYIYRLLTPLVFVFVVPNVKC